jgi:hypothetical protein
MGHKVKCIVCGQDTERLWKVAFNPGLAAFDPEGNAHESGLCDDCDEGGAHAFPMFDSVYEIVNVITGEVLWKEGEPWPG